MIATVPFHPPENSFASAAIVVPFLMKRLRPRSVLDLGCNVGHWVTTFQEEGVTATGVDGPGMGARVEHDLREPLDLGRFYDLVLCLEVAEHLEPEYADTLVDSAIRHACKTIIWSAATPGQGGYHHVNEQAHAYWVTKFSNRGWWGRSLTHLLPPIPHDYYRTNLLEFVPYAHI